MSIASGFDDCVEWDDHNRMYYPVERVDQLLSHARSVEAQNEELKAMLMKHTWTYEEDAHEYWCVECRESEPIHSPDCALAKLIGG